MRLFIDKCRLLLVMEHLDAISFGVFSFLEAHERVSRVEAAPLVGATQLELKLWEQQNLPHKLPKDMQHFYMLVNGLSVKWFAPFRGETILVGHFLLNSLQSLQRISIANFFSQCRAADQHRLGLETFYNNLVGFILESSLQYGNVVLLYLPGPQIWFQDIRGKWSFLAETFSNYYRMMLTHLGIISWQPWLYLFIKSRMLINEEACDQSSYDK
ncbi:putative tubulin polyglutamylase complex subunit 2 [Plasmopara halstedii]